MTILHVNYITNCKTCLYFHALFVMNTQYSMHTCFGLICCSSCRSVVVCLLTSHSTIFKSYYVAAYFMECNIAMSFN